MAERDPGAGIVHDLPGARGNDRGRLAGATPAEAAAWEAQLERTVVSLRPIGSPVALGFLALAAATWMLSAFQLGWIPAADGTRVAIVLVGFAFVAQLVAAFVSFLARDGGAATAMGQLALAWLVVGWSLLTLPPGATSDALGAFLGFAGVSLLLTATATATGKLVPAAIFALAGARFLATGIHELGAGEIVEDLGGALGLALAGLALYAALAAQLEDALGKPVLPLGRRGRAKTAVHGSLLEQTRSVQSEPGVRVQL